MIILVQAGKNVSEWQKSLELLRKSNIDQLILFGLLIS